MTEPKKSFDDLDAVKVIVEALEKFNDDDRKRVIRWSCERLNTDLGFDSSKKICCEESASADPVLEQEVQKNQFLDIKSFVKWKKPSSDIQFAAVVAYYNKFEAKEGERKEFIMSTDLVDASRLAEWERFKNPVKTLNNAYSNSGYLDRVEPGTYKLNSVGENLVAMVLPAKEGEIEVKKRKNRKKKVVKKKPGEKKSTKKTSKK